MIVKITKVRRIHVPGAGAARGTGLRTSGVTTRATTGQVADSQQRDLHIARARGLRGSEDETSRAGFTRDTLTGEYDEEVPQEIDSRYRRSAGIHEQGAVNESSWEYREHRHDAEHALRDGGANAMSATRSTDEMPRTSARDADVADFVFHVLGADRPLGDSSRHSLADLEEVVITRGPRGYRRERGRLTLSFDDHWMSVSHATLVRLGGRWQIDCARAKNAGYRNAQRIVTSLLCDGDVLELGHSFFVFRTGQPSPRGAPLDVSMDELGGVAPRLRSMSPRLGVLFEGLAAIAPSDLPLAIAGETGTGKELIARAVHDLGRCRGAFVAVNCGALPATLVESELFGFRRGAFSGADQDRPGLVRSADHGTLFLDEVVELPRAAQVALLRVLQEREVLALGSTRPVPVEFRLVVASHRDLDEAVESGQLREDLRARFHGFTARLPPLRHRREDLGLLCSTLARCPRTGEPSILGRSAARELLHRPWPRNIRELERCLRVAVTLAGDGVIEAHHLSGALAPEEAAPATGPSGRASPASPNLSGMDAGSIARRERLDGLLSEHRGNVTQVARALGKPRMQVYRWVVRYGLVLSTYR
jgi:DNA-binding NtrC family response regulator